MRGNRDIVFTIVAREGICRPLHLCNSKDGARVAAKCQRVISEGLGLVYVNGYGMWHLLMCMCCTG